MAITRLDIAGTIVVVVAALRALDLRDALAVCSVCAVVYGVSLWSVPAAWITGGGMGLTVWVRPHLMRRR